MSTKTILRLCILMILSVFFLNPSSVTIAEDSQCDQSSPTSPGNVNRPLELCCEYSGNNIVITATYTNQEDDTIDSNHPVTLSATGGCPTYTWSTDSMGYHLSSDEGETVILSVDSGECGVDFDIVAVVTVEDSCDPPKSDTIKIRHSSGGWGPYTRIYTCPVGGDGEVTYLGGGQWVSILISEDKKYKQITQKFGSHVCGGPSGWVQSCDDWNIEEEYYEPHNWEPCITDPDEAYVVPCKEDPPCSSEGGGFVYGYYKNLDESTWVCQY